MSGFDLGARDGYARFLLAQAPAFLAVEEALTQAGARNLLGDWAQRRRSADLEADIRALGFPVPSPSPSPVFDTAAAVLGAIYVLEGSRLGATVIRRAIAADLPATFLITRNPGAWGAFVAIVDRKLSSREDVDTATVAANEVFKLFETSARNFLGAENP